MFVWVVGSWEDTGEATRSEDANTLVRGCADSLIGRVQLSGSISRRHWTEGPSDGTIRDIIATLGVLGSHA